MEAEIYGWIDYTADYTRSERIFMHSKRMVLMATMVWNYQSRFT